MPAHAQPPRPSPHPASQQPAVAAQPSPSPSQHPTAAHPAATVPWEALSPYRLEYTPLPLDDRVLGGGKDAAISDALGHYADPVATPQPLGPVPTPAGPLSRSQALAAEQTQLRAADWVADHLPNETKVPYLEQRLGQLQTFAKTHPAETATNGTVPDELVKDARPLIEDLERIPAAPGAKPVSSNPDAAHVGSGKDWNTELGVPEYRSQSTNLIPPEASCNMTSLAVALERVGIGREQSMAAIELELKTKYLDEQRRKLVAEKKDPSTLPAAKDVTLPPGYFETSVKGYLKSIDDAADKPYQGVRGKDTSEQARSQVAAQYHDNAQFQDTLDYLRYLTNAGDRTNLDAVAPKLLEKLEPDRDKRPTYRSVTPGRNMNWQGARGQLDEVLGEGGSAMLSYEHKGGNNTAASHIISVQSMTADGVTVDDPYGRARDDYRLSQVGDAYGPKGGGPRSADRKNQVDYGTAGRGDPNHIDSNWTAARGQNLQASESHGESVSLPNEVFASSWRSLRFLEPAKPHPADPSAAAPQPASASRS